MIDLLHAVADGGDLIHYWKIAARREGVLLRMKSRCRYVTEHEAVEVTEQIIAQVRPSGYAVRTLRARAQAAGAGECGWHAYVEILVS